MIYDSDYDFCCSILFVRGFGDVLNSYPESFGTYYRHGKFNGNNVYKLVNTEYYLFRSRFQHEKIDDEVWMVI